MKRLLLTLSFLLVFTSAGHAQQIFKQVEGTYSSNAVTTSVTNVTIAAGTSAIEIASDAASPNVVHYRLGAASGEVENDDGIVLPGAIRYIPAGPTDLELSLKTDAGSATVYVTEGHLYGVNP